MNSLATLTSTLLAIFLFVEPAFVHPGQNTAAPIAFEDDIKLKTSTPHVSSNVGVSQMPGNNHLTMTAQETFVEFVVNFDAAYTSTKRPSGVGTNRKYHTFLVANSSAYRHSIQSYININSEKNTQCRSTVLWFKFNAKTETFGSGPYNHGIIGHQEWPLRLLGMFKSVSGDIGRGLSGNKGSVGKKQCQ